MLTEDYIRNKIAENNGKGVWIEGISNEDYHKMPGHSSSDIKEIINGTVKKWLHKKKNPKNPTPDMILGTMIHTYVLEFDHFWKRYFKEEEVPLAPGRNTKDGKILFAQWEQENPDVLAKYKGELKPFEWQIEYIKSYHPKYEGMMSISPEQLAIVEGVSKSIKAHPDLSKLMNPEHCKSEISMFWIDPATDLLCKCRPDVNNFKWPCTLDVKSCQDADLDAFEGDITNRDMHVSAWWYLWGSSQVFEEQYDEFIYIPCEKTEPYEVTYYPADVLSLGVGEGLCRAGLTILKRHYDQAKENPNVDSGYSKNVKTAGIRSWAANKLKQVIHKHDLEKYDLEKYLGVK